MAKYTVTERSFVNNTIAEIGEVIEYDPPEGTEVAGNLVLVVDAPADPPAEPAKGK